MVLLKDQTKDNKKAADDKSVKIADAKITEKSKDAKTGEVKSGKKSFSNAYKVIIKPLITEKAANIGAQNKYIFEVSINTNKIEISKAINDIYGVVPVSVNILRMDGKKLNYGRVSGRRKKWKKAIVTLPKGRTINIYEGV